MRNLRFRPYRVMLAPVLAAALAAIAIAAPAPRPAMPASTSVLSADKGKLRITIGGQRIGEEDFEISGSGDAWTERSTMTAKTPGGPDVKASGQLRLSSEGVPLRYEWSAEAQKKAAGSVEFSGSTAKCTGDFGAATPMHRDFTFSAPKIAVLDNNLYYQYAILARIYDWTAGGKQTFAVLIPQDMTPGSINVEAVSGQPGGGKFETLRASTSDLEILLYVDSSHKLMRLEVPASSAVIERE